MGSFGSISISDDNSVTKTLRLEHFTSDQSMQKVTSLSNLFNNTQHILPYTYIEECNNALEIHQKYCEEGNLYCYLKTYLRHHLNYLSRSQYNPLHDSVLNAKMNLMIKCVTCLKELHQQSDITGHGNIHPGNFLIQKVQALASKLTEENIQMLLSDFGIAAEVFCDRSKKERNKDLSWFQGWFFQSPEFFLTYNREDIKKADVFSLGCIFAIILKIESGDMNPIKFMSRPIGQCMAELHQSPEDNPPIKVITDYREGGDQPQDLLKDLINRMTNDLPTQRPTADEVLCYLRRIQRFEELFVSEEGWVLLETEVGAKWQDVGTLLGLSEGDLSIISGYMQNGKILSTFREMIHHWMHSNTKSKRDKLGQLLYACQEIGRLDIASYLNGEEENFQKCDEVLYYQIGKGFGYGWEKVGQRLRLTDTDIREIKLASPDNPQMAGKKVLVKYFQKNLPKKANLLSILHETLKELHMAPALKQLEICMSKSSENQLLTFQQPLALCTIHSTPQEASASASPESDMRQALLPGFAQYIREKNLEKIFRGIAIMERHIEIMVSSKEGKHQMHVNMTRDKPLGDYQHIICIFQPESLAGDIQIGTTIKSAGSDQGGRIGLFAKDQRNQIYLLTTLHSLGLGKGKVSVDSADFELVTSDEHGFKNYPFSSRCLGYYAPYRYSNSKLPAHIDIAAILLSPYDDIPINHTDARPIRLQNVYERKDLTKDVKIVDSEKMMSQLPDAEIINADGRFKQGDIWCGGHIILKSAKRVELYFGKGDSGCVLVSESGGSLTAYGLLCEAYCLDGEQRYIAMNLLLGLQCLKDIFGLCLNPVQIGCFENKSEVITPAFKKMNIDEKRYDLPIVGKSDLEKIENIETESVESKGVKSVSEIKTMASEETKGLPYNVVEKKVSWSKDDLFLKDLLDTKSQEEYEHVFSSYSKTSGEVKINRKKIALKKPDFQYVPDRASSKTETVTEAEKIRIMTEAGSDQHTFSGIVQNMATKTLYVKKMSDVLWDVCQLQLVSGRLWVLMYDRIVVLTERGAVAETLTPGFSWAVDMCVSGSGHVIIATTDSGLIQLSSEGRLFRCIDEGRYWSVVYSDQSSVWAVKEERGAGVWIIKYKVSSENCEQLVKVQKEVRAGGLWVYCALLQNNLYLCSDCGDCIYVVDTSDGRTLATHGKKGREAPGKLWGPTTIYSDPVSQSLLVTDYGNHRLQVFEPAKDRWTIVTTTGYKIEYPRAAAVDGQGQIWVMCGLDGHLYKFVYSGLIDRTFPTSKQISH